MTERILRCPRCGQSTPIAGGKCEHCGLTVAFARRAQHRPASVGRRGAVQIEAGVDRVDEEFAGVSLAPGARGASGAAGGLTQRYDVANLRPRPAARAAIQNGTPVESVIQTGRYDVDNGRQGGVEPKGGDVEVGALSSMLMDPTENPHENEFEKRGVETTVDGKLEVGQRLYGDKAAPRDELRLAPSAPAAGDSPEAPPPPPRRRPVAQSPADSSAGIELSDRRRRYFTTRVLPLLVALALVGLVGRRFVTGPIALADVYNAVFLDDHGRKVNCQATFTPGPNDRFAVTGTFECRLYEKEYSTDRVDEPEALKLIAGDGVIAFLGRYDAQGVALQLGALDPADSRAVRLTGRFVGDASQIAGEIVDSLGHRAKVKMDKKL